MEYQVHFKSSAERLRIEIEQKINSLGILFRVFGRGKDHYSLKNKLAREPGKYSADSKLIQDCIGIRIVLYFHEDIETVRKVLCKAYSLRQADSTIDAHETDQFSVTRYNLIFELPTHHVSEINRFNTIYPIDQTFEVQIRTMLSEGWHEVEHDLRYKCKEHWEGQHDLSRALNGIMATIETAEWSMKKIFDDLSYRHYKNKNWPAMLHTKLRMRLNAKLSKEITEILDSDPQLAKDLFRIDRFVVIERLFELEPKIPVNLDNIVYVYNKFNLKNDSLSKITPTLISELSD